MQKILQALALLLTGLLAGVFYYGTFTVIPAFYEVPLTVHLQYRVELMNHNAVYVQFLTAFSIIAPAIYAISVRRNLKLRNLAFAAAITALISILVTRFGNVPINRMMRVWESGTAPANWREILDGWNMFNDIRTFFGMASFILMLIASQSKPTITKP
ncbi:MAG TPA: DUF1772 domain-containing protein [Puia sp.]|jgi:uncharacterized membrane protein|nr:DUF1772 domain-containing protein [Puia sp.]